MVHVLKLSDKKYRIVKGKLVNELSIDWSIGDLGELKKLIEFAVRFDGLFPSLTKAKYKNLKIHEGANHLTIEDHCV